MCCPSSNLLAANCYGHSPERLGSKRYPCYRHSVYLGAYLHRKIINNPHLNFTPPFTANSMLVVVFDEMRIACISTCVLPTSPLAPSKLARCGILISASEKRMCMTLIFTNCDLVLLRHLSIVFPCATTLFRRRAMMAHCTVTLCGKRMEGV